MAEEWCKCSDPSCIRSHGIRAQSTVPAPPVCESNSVTYQEPDLGETQDIEKCPNCHGYHIGGCHKKAPAPPSEKCPTCDSDNRAIRNIGGRLLRTGPVVCSDPWHDSGESSTAAPVDDALVREARIAYTVYSSDHTDFRPIAHMIADFARAHAQKLEAQLREYGRHKANCNRYVAVTLRGDSPCDCGWNELQAALRELLEATVSGNPERLNAAQRQAQRIFQGAALSSPEPTKEPK